MSVRRAAVWLRLAMAVVLLGWLMQPALPAGAQSQQQSPYVVIVLDDTASLTGNAPDPRAQDIWADVQAAAVRLVNSQPAGTRLLIAPFANGPELTNLYPRQARPSAGGVTWKTLATADDARESAAFVNGLPANGQSTAIFPAVKFGADQLAAIAASPEGAGHPLSLYLFTDGLDTSGNKQWLDQASNLLATLRQDPATQFLYSGFIQFGQGLGTPCPPGGFDACAGTSPERPLAFARLTTAAVTFPPLSGRPLRSQAAVPVSISIGAAAPPSAEVDVERTVDQPVGAKLRLLAPSTLAENGDQSHITIDIEGDPTLPPDRYTGALVFQSSDLLFVEGNRLPYEVSYTGEPTPTATAAPSATSTPSPLPSATATRAPAATATPSPAPTATATATPPPPLPPCDPSQEGGCGGMQWWQIALAVLVLASLAGVAENFLAARY